MKVSTNKITLISVLGLFVAPFAAFADSDQLAGTWSGSGVMKMISGERHKVRCAITYIRKSQGNYAMEGNCTADWGGTDGVGSVRQTSAGQYAGSFSNAQYKVSGPLSVTVNGFVQTLRLSSKKVGSATLKLRR